jgi:hypothetical protein
MQCEYEMMPGSNILTSDDYDFVFQAGKGFVGDLELSNHCA